MLRFLRKYSNSTGIKVLYGALALLFVIWGVGSVGGERVDVVAKVHGETITTRELERTTGVLRQQYEEMFKGNFSPELARSLDLRGRALDQLIDDALRREEAKRLGITVSDDELVDEITRIPGLQSNGRFDRDRLEAYLRYERDRGEFEADVRRSLLSQRLNALVTDGVQVSDGEVEDRYRLDHEQADLAFVRVVAADLAKDGTVTDDELQKYLADHADRYKVPAKVRMRYAIYKPAEFAATVNPTDGEIAEYYELHKDDRYTQPEQVHARHILVKVPDGADDAAKAAARKKAELLLAKVKGGGDFATYAKNNSDDPGSKENGGDLGLFPRGRMTPAFEEAAFALQPGAISDIVETQFGFHIIKVEEHQQASVKSLDAARDEIVAAIRNERGAELARRQADEDHRAVTRGKSFQDAVGTRRLGETPPFAVTDFIPDIGPVQPVADAAFALRTGEVSDPIEQDDVVYLVSPLEHIDARTSTLDEVRTRLEADVRRERGQQKAKDKGDALLARAKDVGLDKAAADAGLTVDTTGPFERKAPAIPKIAGAFDLRTDAFTLTTEAPLGKKVYISGGDAIVVALRSRTPADMAGLAAEKDKLRDSLLQQKRTQVATAYMAFLKERAQREGALQVRTDVVGRS